MGLDDMKCSAHIRRLAILREDRPADERAALRAAAHALFAVEELQILLYRIPKEITALRSAVITSQHDASMRVIVRMLAHTTDAQDRAALRAGLRSLGAIDQIQLVLDQLEDETIVPCVPESARYTREISWERAGREYACALVDESTKERILIGYRTTFIEAEQCLDEEMARRLEHGHDHVCH